MNSSSQKVHKYWEEENQRQAITAGKVCQSKISFPSNLIPVSKPSFLKKNLKASSHHHLLIRKENISLISAKLVHSGFHFNSV
jgi:hypothetical protein